MSTDIEVLAVNFKGQVGLIRIGSAVVSLSVPVATKTNIRVVAAAADEVIGAETARALGHCRHDFHGSDIAD